jgi:3-isopropylmalate/(R)-2-methylmalate dehydratase small subunit
VVALRQFGIRCIVAPSFGAIFRNNCIRNAVLSVELPAALVHRLGTVAEAHPQGWVVDLESCELVEFDGRHHAFTIDPRAREILLSGLDAIDLTWQRRAQIEVFELADRLHRPWIWD